MPKAVSRRLLIAAILVATNPCVSAEDLDKGRIEFLSKCAECHGADGKGQEAMSSKLKVKPADLTLLAKRNNGVFSPDSVVSKVDGRSAIRGHSAEMPIWGCRQELPPGSRKKRHRPKVKAEPKPIESLLDIPCEPEEVIRKRILDIVEYLRRIQEQ